MAEPAAASPCVNVCRMDEARGLCLGCARTLDEIASWSRATEAERRAVLEQLPGRRAEWTSPPSAPLETPWP